MIGRKTEFQTKKFNWTTRILRLQRKYNRNLVCSRFQFKNYAFSHIFSNTHPFTWSSHVSHDFNLVERTRFRCNKMLSLNGFICEGFESQRPATAVMQRYPVNVRIFKIDTDGDNNIELFNQQMMLNFTERRKCVKYPSNKSRVKLEPAILIRPKYVYEIEIRFQTQPQVRIRNHCALKSSVRVDHNIVIEFGGERGAISSLNISRIDKENYSEKVFQNPEFYLLILIIFWFIRLYLTQVSNANRDRFSDCFAIVFLPILLFLGLKFTIENEQ